MIPRRIREKLRNPIKPSSSLDEKIPRSWRLFPQVIQVDTNNYCGRAYTKTRLNDPTDRGILCSYCYPQWKIAQGKRSYMEMPMYQMEWVMRETNRDGRMSMKFVDWFLNGDALTEPRAHDIYAMSKKICPWLMTSNFTNGVNTNKIDLILDRNLDIVHFTISAHNRELYKIVHGGDHFDDAIKTLETFLDKRYRNQLIEVHTVITKHNAPYLQEWWDFFGKYPNITRRISPLVASYDNLPSKLALGDLTLDKQEEMIIKVGGPQFRMWTRALIPDEQPCNLWHNLAFDVEGYFLQCCNWSPPDEVNYGKIDDFIEEGRTLKEVWTERLANRMRNKLCRSCNMKHPEYVKRLAAMRIDLP